MSTTGKADYPKKHAVKRAAQPPLQRRGGAAIAAKGSTKTNLTTADGSTIMLRKDPFEELAEERESADEFPWDAFPPKKGNLVRIGVHETTTENINTLKKDGPIEQKIGTGNGIGKGAGFYVTNVNKSLKAAVKGAVWGEVFTVVYIADFIKKCVSEGEETNSVDAMDELYGDELCYYVMSGGSEILIPPRCFPYVRIVSVPVETKQMTKPVKPANPVPQVEEEYGDNKRAIWQEECEQVEELNKLSAKYVAPGITEGEKKRIKKRWDFIESTLYRRYLMNGRAYTLWAKMSPLGYQTDAPAMPQ